MKPSKSPKTALGATKKPESDTRAIVPKKQTVTKISGYALCEKAENLKKEIEIKFLELGETIKIIKATDGWVGRYEDIDDFYENGLHMKRGTVSKLVNIYDIFIEKYQFPRETIASASWTKLYLITSKIEISTKEEADQWLTRAIKLTRTDLDRYITEKNNGKDMSVCKHDETETVVLHICKSCGIKLKNHDEAEN